MKPGSPKPETPKPEIRNPKPGTQKPGTHKPETLTPTPYTLNTKTRILPLTPPPFPTRALLLRRLLKNDRCRANMAHIRQSRPDSGLGSQVKVLKLLNVVPFSLLSLGTRRTLEPLALYWSHWPGRLVNRGGGWLFSEGSNPD